MLKTLLRTLPLACFCFCCFCFCFFLFSITTMAQDTPTDHTAETREKKIRTRSIERRKFAPGFIESVKKLFAEIEESKLENNLKDSLYLIDAVTKDYETQDGKGPSERVRELVDKMKRQFSKFLRKKTDEELHAFLIKVSAQANDAPECIRRKSRGDVPPNTASEFETVKFTTSRFAL